MMNYILVGILGGQEIIIIAIVILLLFGGRKIPELMRGLGRGVKEFKDGTKGVADEINDSVNTDNTDNKK